MSLGLAFGGLACGAILGIEDATDRLDAADGSPDVIIPSDAPACASTCAMAPPLGWDGPFAVFEATGGPPSPTAPDCTGAFAKTIYDGTSSLVAPPASCTCECGAVTGATCIPPKVDFYSDTGCATKCSANQPTSAIACAPLTNGGCGADPKGITVGPTVASGGVCTKTDVTDKKPAAWETTFRLCAMPAPIIQRCDAGQVCVANPTLPQAPGTLCVARPGDAECPSGYAVKKSAYTSFKDDRACGTCTCGQPHDVTCSPYTGKFRDGPNCSAGNHPWASDSACYTGVKPSSVETSGSATEGVASGGACDRQTGGVPTGSATPAAPTTICCTN